MHRKAGLLLIFAGHFVGLPTAIWVFGEIGISHSFKQGPAIAIGGLAGVACFAGIAPLAPPAAVRPASADPARCRRRCGCA